MTRLFSILAAFLLTFAAHAANAKITKVNVVGVPEDVERLAVNNGTCIALYLCEKRKNPGVWTYNSQVWGTAKFLPGTITLHDGTVLSGQVALIQRSQDWKFVKHFALIVLEGETDAIYVGPGFAFLITQQTKKSNDVYDMYGNVYLQRLVSGPLRLSFNPSAGTTRNISEFLPAGFVQDAQRQLAAREVMAAIKNGENLSEVSEGGTPSQALADIVASIEITEKEYLLYNEAKAETSLITKNNHKETMALLFSACPEADPDMVKRHSKSFKKIVEAFEYLNANCTFEQ